MSDSATAPDVRDDPEHSRFVLEQDGHQAELVYIRRPGQMILAHTEVPDALGGHGIGGKLVRAAIERAAADGLTVVPWCPFARRWLREHEDVARRVTMDRKTPPPSGG